MDRTRISHLFAMGMLLAASLGCGLNIPQQATQESTPPAKPSNTAAPVLTPTPTITPTSTIIPTPVYNENGVRICDFVPGESVAAEVPPEVANAPTATPFPTGTPPASTSVDAAITTRQLGLYRELWNIVNQNYVDPEFGGHDWQAIGAQYEALIEQGLTAEDFTAAMGQMILELGDEHSYYQSAEEIAAEQAALAGVNDFVGIGMVALPIDNLQHAVILSVFPDSPAADALLRSHDILLSVDGGPVRDENGIARTLGPEGSEVVLTVQRPGEQPRDVTLIRRRVTGAYPVDYCLFPDTRIGYMMFPTFLDETIDDQARTALQQMTVDGPLDGLIVDNRVNTGGSGAVFNPVLGLFTSGEQGSFVSRSSGRQPLFVQPEDIGGSQTVPMVVLVGRETASYGEVMSGILGLSERATLIGETTNGNVERLRRFDLSDGSRVWLAADTFEPLELTPGIWEETGIVPEIITITLWQAFTEATDPGIAAALEVLMGE
jgi:carboxyl-terminal processing protease